MADWHIICAKFDEPISDEIATLLRTEIGDIDYDAPVKHIHSMGWTRCYYRSPFDGAIEKIIEAFEKHGVKGQGSIFHVWDCSDEYREPHPDECFKFGKTKADLTILLQGGSSMPMSKIAEIIHQALSGAGLNVAVEESQSDEWKFGWDGLLGDESVLIREDKPYRWK